MTSSKEMERVYSYNPGLAGGLGSDNNIHRLVQTDDHRYLHGWRRQRFVSASANRFRRWRYLLR